MSSEYDIETLKILKCVLRESLSSVMVGGILMTQKIEYANPKDLRETIDWLEAKLEKGGHNE